MSRLRSGPLSLTLALGLLWLPSAATAQAVTGTISGTIVDHQGQVIPGATVAVVNESTIDSRAAVSDERIQLRWEAYNVFNQVNWLTLDTTAQFNPAGEQVNAAFGQALTARDPRIMQGAIRFSF